MIKSINGEVITLSPTEEAEVLALRAAYDPVPDLQSILLSIELKNIIEDLLAPKKAQINNMNETALRIAIAANGLQ